MDSYTIDKMKHLSNTEVVRRLLIKYFMDKGFTESFDRQLYPSVVQDLPLAIPILMDKIEIEPFAENIDALSSRATLGWNLFVLGNHRMFLGNTEHNDLSALARQIRSGVIMPEGVSSARRQTTPRRVVAFITRVLSNHEGGYVNLMPSTKQMVPGEPYQARGAMSGVPNQFGRAGYGT
jgi:hypothetical protein